MWEQRCTACEMLLLLFVAVASGQRIVIMCCFMVRQSQGQGHAMSWDEKRLPLMWGTQEPGPETILEMRLPTIQVQGPSRKTSVSQDRKEQGIPALKALSSPAITLTLTLTHRRIWESTRTSKHALNLNSIHTAASSYLSGVGRIPALETLVFPIPKPNQTFCSPAAEPRESRARKHVELPLHSHQAYFIFLWVELAPLEFSWGPAQPGE